LGTGFPDALYVAKAVVAQVCVRQNNCAQKGWDLVEKGCSTIV